jgi:hypothetical protein
MDARECICRATPYTPSPVSPSATSDLAQLDYPLPMPSHRHADVHCEDEFAICVSSSMVHTLASTPAFSSAISVDLTRLGCPLQMPSHRYAYVHCREHALEYVFRAKCTHLGVRPSLLQCNLCRLDAVGLPAAHAQQTHALGHGDGIGLDVLYTPGVAQRDARGGQPMAAHMQINVSG